jgi:hypothetical protein
MQDFAQDLRVAWRHLIGRPVSTAVAVLTLGIGLGINGVAFSVVNGVVFKNGPAAVAAGGPDSDHPRRR